MNNKLTLGLLTAALAAVGYFIWIERDRPGTQATALAERKLLPLVAHEAKPTPIDRIEVTGPKGKMILALDRARAWHLLAPVADRANPATVRELVAALDTALKFDSLPATPANLERCGLREPDMRMKIFRGAESPVELQLGARTAVDGRIYARLAGAAEVAVIPEQIATLARRPVDGFRDLRLFDFGPAEVVRVRIRNPWGDFELARDRGHWELTKPAPARADDKAVNDWLERLCTSEVHLFAPSEAGDLLSFGLMAPRGSVQLELETDADEPARVVELQLGRRAEPRFAEDATLVRVPERGLVAAVPLVIEEALLLEPDALREHTLFALNPDLVDRIRIRPAAGPEMLLARLGEKWTLVEPGPMPVEQSQVARLMQQLPGGRVREFLTAAAADAARAELESPVVRVTFASFSSENTAESAAGETPIATISLGRARPDESMVVRVEEDNVIARVDASLLAAIPTDPLEWRPLALFETPPAIQSLTIQEADRSGSYVRDGNTWKRVGEAAPAVGAVESAAALLAGLRAVRWIGSVQPAHGLDAPSLVVRGNAGGGSVIELRIGKKTADGMWPAAMSGRSGVFLLSDPDRQILAAPLH